MNVLNVFVLHQIVGGLRPGALPHEESLWCRRSDSPESSPQIEQRDLRDAPTQDPSGDASQ